MLLKGVYNVHAAAGLTPFYNFNLIKAGGLNLCIDWGGASHAPSLKIMALENRYRVASSQPNFSRPVH